MQRCAHRILVLMALLVLSGCESLGQQSCRVFKREGTDGILKDGGRASEAAREHLPYVWASIAAYQKPPPKQLENCPTDAERVLQTEWVAWEEIPRLIQTDTRLAKDMADAHLRVRVYSNQRLNTVIVAFGGTDSMKDMVANLRWFLPKDVDQYYVLRTKFVPAFKELWDAKKTSQKFAWISSAKLVSTGHSLGGGLAQGFAYAARALRLPIERAVVFNPSPVSGKRDVLNYRELAPFISVERIYNRGEVLAGIRAAFNVTMKPGPEDAKFTDYRYAFDWKWYTNFTHGFFKAHALYPLACNMTKAAQADVP